jgi:hypothetical protein
MSYDRLEKIDALPNDQLGAFEAVRRLDGLIPDGGGSADAHEAADLIMLECLPGTVRRAYRDLVDRADWWATA